MTKLTEAQVRVLRELADTGSLSLGHDSIVVADLHFRRLLVVHTAMNGTTYELTPAGREALAEYEAELYRLGGLTVESVKRGEADHRAGRTTPFEDVKKEMKD